MLKRRRAALALLAVAAAAVFVLPASPASAVPVDNACRNSVTANNSQISADTSATDSPDPVAPGGTVTLDNLTQTANVPGAIFVAGYNLGLLVEGSNTIPATVSTFIEATNTVEGVKQTNFASTTITTVIDDPDNAPGTGDETATDGQFTVVYDDLTFTASGPDGSTIEFREDTRYPLVASPQGSEVGGIIIRALVGGVFNVRFACSPGTVTPPDPGTVTPIDPAPSFATTLIQVPEPQRQISINDVTQAEGNSGQTAFQFTVSLDAASANPVTVDYATANGTATAPGDYTAGTGTVTFAPGDTSETVTVQVNGDTAVEPDETFNVNLSNATGNAAILDGQGVGTITNDDVAASSISIDEVIHEEGDSGQTAYVFTVSLSAPQVAQVTVDFATADLTATAPSDYTAATGTVTFAPGDTSETVTVQVNGDTAVEPDETFNVNLSNVVGNATILDGTGIGTIGNDDVAASDISISDAAATEGGAVQFTVSLSAPQAGTVTVDYATADGSAVAPGDYTAGTGTVTFAPGDTSETVSVQTNDDALAEGAETFNVTLSNVTGNATIADGTGVGTINDNDVANTAPTAAAGDDQTVDSGATVQLDGTGSTDPENDTLTYAWSQLSGPAVTLSDPSSATPTFTAPTGPASLEFQLEVCDPEPLCDTDTVVIDVNAPPASTISISDAAATEGGAVQFTVSLSAPQAGTVTVDYATADGSAVAPGDYTAGTGTVTFAPGDTSETVSVQTNDDALAEGAETFNVTLSNVTGNATIADGTGVGTINDNDVANTAPTAAAGDDQTVDSGATVQLDGTGSTDPENDTLTYAWSQLSGPAVTLSDPSSATPTFTAPTGPASLEFQLEVCDPEPLCDTDTVVIDVNAPPASTISISDAAATEGGAVQFTVSLSAPQAGTVTVDYATADGSAVAPGDYTAGTGTVTFAPGDTSETVSVQTNDDALAEGAETFNVTLSNVTGNATIADGTGVGTINDNDVANTAPTAAAGDDQTVDSGATVQLDGTGSTDPENDTLTYAWSQLSGPTVTLSDPSSATPTFTAPTGPASLEFQLEVCDPEPLCDTDTVVIDVNAPPASTISISDAAATEGGAVQFTVSLSAPQAGTVTVDYATADGSAVAPGDYTAGTGTVTFAPGDTSETVSVQTNDDALAEGTETFNVTLSNVTGNATIADGTGVGTINDNDVANTAPTAAAGDDQTVDSGATVQLDGTGSTDPENDTLTYAWSQLSGPTVTLSDPSSATPTFTAPTGPASLEFQLEVCDPEPLCDTDTVVIDVNAPPASTISISDAAATEGGAVQFTVSLSAPQAASVTVDYATADGSAVAPGDYTAGTGTVTFAPGDTSETVSVQTNDDALAEGTETFNVTLSNVTGNATIADGTGVGTINDNDALETIDASGDVIVNGPVSAKKTSKSFVFKVSNEGTAPITITAGDITTSVEVNGTTTGTVSVAGLPVTIKPGASKQLKAVWSYPAGAFAAGATIDFNACVELTGDVDTSNDCDTATLVASK